MNIFGQRITFAFKTAVRMTDFATFVKAHMQDDVRALALQSHKYEGLDVKKALVQIDGWQRARRKLPAWACTEGIIYPVHLSMEQCSSELTARYKAGIVDAGGRMADLTAGFGVDAVMLSRRYGHLTYVEQDEELCRIARHNLPLLGVDSFEVLCAKAEEAILSIPHQNLVFIDPARRDVNGGKVVTISDCSPDVSKLQSLLMEKADVVLVKLSPMLDLKCIERELQGVSEIHVVSVDNECKEVLVKLSSDAGGLQIVCANLSDGREDETLAFTPQEETTAVCHYTDAVSTYIFEPNSSVMKVGCFKTVAQRYGLYKFHPNSHLYTAEHDVTDFPGRRFKVLDASGFNKRELGRLLSGMSQANMTVRNFPLSVAELRRRLKLRDGGDRYIFATTLADGKHVLVLCEKA